MVRKSVIFALLFVASLVSSSYIAAQEPQPVISTVMYNLTQVTDTNNRTNLFHERWVLYIGTSSAMFQSYSKLVRDSILLGKLKTGASTFSGDGVSKVNHTQFFFFEDRSKHFRMEPFFSNYVFPLERPDYNWKVLPEKKMISGLACQKAAGYWMGRNYTAWFTPELPLPYGPWNMNGLPGLILEAYDTEREVVFEFAGFAKNNDSKIKIAFPPDKLVRTTEKEYRKLATTARQDPVAFLKNVLGLSGQVSGYNPNRTPSVNNPIELEQK